MAEDTLAQTLYEVETYKSIADTHVRQWHKNISRWRKWYDFDHYTKRPLPYEERYPDPTPTNVVDLAVGIIMAKGIEWKAKGWEPSQAEQEDSSDIEKFLAGILYVNNERNKYLIEYEAVLNLVRDGAAVVYTVWDKELDEEYGDELEINIGQGQPVTVKLYNEAPIRTEIIDPLQIWLVPGGPRRWSHIIREWEMTAWDVEQTFGKRLERYKDITEAMRMQSKVKVQDYWHIKKDDGKIVVRNALVADGDVIRPLRDMDGYKDLPYTIGFYKPIYHGDPKGWHGIIRPLEDTIQFLEKAINRRQRQIFVYSALPFVAKAIPNRTINLDPALGNLVHLDVNEGLEFPSWQGNPPDTESQIGFFRARLQQTGFSDVMYGAGTSQVSGYALSQLSDQSRIRLTQPIRHLEMMWTDWGRKCLSLVENFVSANSVMRVYGEMRGQDFAAQVAGRQLSGYMIKASVEPEFPNERVRNHAMAIQVRDILSETTVMERYLDIEQPDDERKRRLQDIAVNHPMMQQFAIMRYIVDLAQNSNDQVLKAAALMTLQQMQAASAQPEGAPAEGNGRPRPGNMLGTPSATGEETPQAEGRPAPGQGFEDIFQNMVEAVPGLTPGGGSF
jgi:hypothetical protein